MESKTRSRTSDNRHLALLTSHEPSRFPYRRRPAGSFLLAAGRESAFTLGSLPGPLEK